MAAICFSTLAFAQSDFDNLRAAIDKRAEPGQIELLVRKIWGDSLAKSPDFRIDQLDAIWAIERKGAKQAEVESQVAGEFHLKLNRLGKTDIFFGQTKLQNGDGFRYRYLVDSKAENGWKQAEAYIRPKELNADPKVPQGKRVAMGKLESKIYPGVSHEWWVTLPANLPQGGKACLMVWQDGQWEKEWVSTLYDNMQATGELPPTVNVFIRPGEFADGKSNRSREYDTLSDEYVRMLLEDFIPKVQEMVEISDDPECWGIAGASSGGICAFTAAWQRPDKFRRVMSAIGSFTNIASGPTGIAGGHNYAAMIRLQPAKPIRVFLQDGKNDLDNKFGNWPLANQQMALALEFSHYDYKFVFGNGFHSWNHIQAISPDALRWLWRKSN